MIMMGGDEDGDADADDYCTMLGADDPMGAEGVGSG